MLSEQIINILGISVALYLEESMSRLLCFPLLFVLALSLFAQDEPPGVEQSLPRDPDLLMRMREHISLELQQTQRMLGLVNPNDTQLIDTLKTQQAELTKQFRNITQHMQAGYQSPTLSGIGDVSPGYSPGRPGMPSMMPTREQEWRTQEPATPMVMPSYPNQPVAPYSMAPNRAEMASSTPVYPIPVQPHNPNPSYGVPNWGDQDRAWEITPWGPRLPKELTEMKQSVESLQKEIGELKETIKALETQIQLLSRTVLLNERVKENGN